MAWTYDETDLDKTTTSGRLNVVRLLIGDTDTNDQLVKNEEITFALSESNNNVYFAGSWAASVIASLFARKVDTKKKKVTDYYVKNGKKYKLEEELGAVQRRGVDLSQKNQKRLKLLGIKTKSKGGAISSKSIAKKYFKGGLV